MSHTAMKPASSKQLRYLRQLAVRTGTTFTYPRSVSEASREIERLREIAKNGRPLPERGCRKDELPSYATEVQASEVRGYGSSASWRSARPARRIGGRR